MSQRDSGYQRKERDLYETPEWATEALRPHLTSIPEFTWEPAAGSGKMGRVILQWGGAVVFSDIEPHACCYEANFLTCNRQPAISLDTVTAIITNPPYALAQEFIQHALRIMKPVGGLVAMLLRTDYDHAATRQHLFSGCKAFAKKVVLTKRIIWFDAPGAAPSFNHAWYIWDWKHEGPPTLAYGPEKASLLGEFSSEFAKLNEKASESAVEKSEERINS